MHGNSRMPASLQGMHRNSQMPVLLQGLHGNSQMPALLQDMHVQCMALINALQSGHGILHPAGRASSQPVLQPHTQQHVPSHHQELRQGQSQHQGQVQLQSHSQEQRQGQGQSYSERQGNGQTHNQGQEHSQFEGQQSLHTAAAATSSAQESAQQPVAGMSRLPSAQPPINAARDASQGMASASAGPSLQRDLQQPKSGSLASLVPPTRSTSNASTDKPNQSRKDTTLAESGSRSPSKRAEAIDLTAESDKDES